MEHWKNGFFDYIRKIKMDSKMDPESKAAVIKSVKKSWKYLSKRQKTLGK